MSESPPKLLPQSVLMRPRWNQLRDIGNSLAAKSSIAIPILGYMLIFNDKVAVYLRLHTDFCQGAACGSSWRLQLFYFGCCFFALGSLLYAIFCPALIKRHKDAATFFAADKEYLSDSTSFAHLLARIQHAKGSAPDDPHDLLNKLATKNERLTPEHFNLLAGPMSEHYYVENRLRAPARIATFLAYSIGGVLLFVPTAVTAFQIAMIVLRTL